MRLDNTGTGVAMRKAALGPAAIAARHGRMRGASTRGLSDSAVMRFGALGDATTAAVGSKAASAGATWATTTYAAGAISSAASAVGAGAAAGTIVPIVGTIIGAVVGLVVGKLLNKQYLNVAQMNAAEAVEVTVFNQYKGVAGRAAGRAYGLAVMVEVWKGALHSGYFSINNVKQCFHEGCSTYPGNASLIDIMIKGGSSDANTFPDVYQKWQAGRTAATSTTPARAVTTTAPVPASAARSGLVIRGNMAGLGCGCNLGSLGATAVPDAVTFIDNYFMPANAPGSKCSGTPCYWAYPRNAMEKQILYDVADAYLATKPVTTTPNGPTQGQTAPPPPAIHPSVVATPVITPVPASGAQPAVNVVRTSQGTVTVPAGFVAGAPDSMQDGFPQTVQYMMPATGQIVPAGTPGAVVSPVAASLTSYLSDAGWWPWILGGAVVLVLLKR